MGTLEYKNISQTFGGGRPVKAIVFLKSGTQPNLPTQGRLEGKVVDLVFRRGSKLGFKEVGSQENQILVIDQEQVDHLYLGKAVDKLDLAQLQVRPSTSPIVVRTGTGTGEVDHGAARGSE